MTIDRDSYMPVYRQIADLIRNRITSGEFPPGSLLQSELAMAQEYTVGRDTVRRAVAVLRSEGLVVTDRGAGTHVRDVGRRETVALPAGVTVEARMPTDPERRRLGIGEGVPVLVVGERVYPADRYRLKTPGIRPEQPDTADGSDPPGA